MDNTGDDQNLSRKERRAQKQREKQARRDQVAQEEQQTDFTQNMLTWGLVSLLGVGLILFVVGLVRDGGNLTQPDEVDIALEDDEWIAGNPDAEVVLVEYGDFQCPACRQAHGMTESLVAQYGDSIAFAFRHFPLPMHQNANDAARAAEAAGRQDAFFPMHDLLFENQPEWEGEGNPYPLFEEYATELDLDLAQFEEDYNSDEVRDAVDADRAAGNGHAVMATPTFFLNGERLSNMSFGEIQTAVVDAIETSQQEPEGTDEEEAPADGDEEVQETE